MHDAGKFVLVVTAVQKNKKHTEFLNEQSLAIWQNSCTKSRNSTQEKCTLISHVEAKKFHQYFG